MPLCSFYLFADEIDDFVKNWVENAQNLSSFEIELCSPNTVDFVVMETRYYIVSQRQVKDYHEITRYREIPVYVSGELLFDLFTVSYILDPRAATLQSR